MHEMRTTRPQAVLVRAQMPPGPFVGQICGQMCSWPFFATDSDNFYASIAPL